jgi:hypothetical protein
MPYGLGTPKIFYLARRGGEVKNKVFRSGNMVIMLTSYRFWLKVNKGAKLENGQWYDACPIDCKCHRKNK